MPEQNALAKHEQTIEKLKEEARFYISTPERAAEALLFVRNLKRFAEEVEAKVKERAVEVMDKKNTDLITYSITDQESGEVREWELRRDYGKQSKEYRPENVFAALGEKAFKYFKVGKVALEKDLTKLSAKGEITMDQVGEATKDPVLKTIKGAGVKLREMKATL